MSRFDFPGAFSGVGQAHRWEVTQRLLSLFAIDHDAHDEGLFAGVRLDNEIEVVSAVIANFLPLGGGLDASDLLRRKRDSHGGLSVE